MVLGLVCIDFVYAIRGAARNQTLWPIMMSLLTQSSIGYILDLVRLSGTENAEFSLRVDYEEQVCWASLI